MAITTAIPRHARRAGLRSFSYWPLPTEPARRLTPALRRLRPVSSRRLALVGCGGSGVRTAPACPEAPVLSVATRRTRWVAPAVVLHLVPVTDHVHDHAARPPHLHL